MARARRRALHLHADDRRRAARLQRSTTYSWNTTAYSKQQQPHARPDRARQRGTTASATRTVTVGSPGTSSLHHAAGERRDGDGHPVVVHLDRGRAAGTRTFQLTARGRRWRPPTTPRTARSACRDHDGTPDAHHAHSVGPRREQQHRASSIRTVRNGSSPLSASFTAPAAARPSAAPSAWERWARADRATPTRSRSTARRLLERVEHVLVEHDDVATPATRSATVRDSTGAIASASRTVTVPERHAAQRVVHEPAAGATVGGP